MRFMQRARVSEEDEDEGEGEAPASTRRSFGGFGAASSAAPAAETVEEAAGSLAVPARAKPGFQTILRVGLDGGQRKFQPPPIPDYGELEVDASLFETPKAKPAAKAAGPKAKTPVASVQSPAPAEARPKSANKRAQPGEVAL